MKIVNQKSLEESNEEPAVSRKYSKMIRQKLSVVSTTETEYQSLLSDDDGRTDDEFYDFSDSFLDEALDSRFSCITLLWQLQQSNNIFSFSIEDSVQEPVQLFDKVDALLEGSSSEHYMALELLSGYEIEVFLVNTFLF